MRTLRWVNIITIAVLTLLTGANAQDDSDYVGTPGFTVTLTNSVDIEIVSSALLTIATTRAHLFHQYLEIGTFGIDVYAITDYEIKGSKITQIEQVLGGTTTALEEIKDHLMEIKTIELTGDDPGDNPTPKGPWFNATVWEDLPDTATIPLFEGGNSEGGAINKHTGIEALRLDLAALQNNASGNVYTFTIVVTVTEKT